MEKLKHKLDNLKKMLTLLERAVDKLQNNSDSDDIEFVRDSVAARFKILIESTWKLIKLYLENKDIEIESSIPRAVIDQAFEINLLSRLETEQLISFIKLRNLASHLYDEPQYLLVIDAAPGAVNLIKNIVKRIEQGKNE